MNYKTGSSKTGNYQSSNLPSHKSCPKQKDMHTIQSPSTK